MQSNVDMKFVLFLECSEDTIKARITKKGVEAGENKRSDDNMETLVKRFKIF